jgi:hypothetical protein
MKWTDDISCASLDRRRVQLQLALYAMHLGSAHTLLSKSIKCATIKNYIFDVASFLRRFDANQRDFRRDHDSDKHFAAPLTKVFTELERWEKVPNRREPFTVEMLLELKRRTASTDPDGLLSVLCDWFEIGLFQGFRRCEWAQESSRSEIGAQELDIFGNTRAFCLHDLMFETMDRQRLIGASVLRSRSQRIRKLFLQYRTQKNGQHGEKKLLTSDQNLCEGLDGVAAFLRIVERFARLRGTDDISTPLAIYTTPDGHVRLITDTVVEYVMRDLAATVYNLDPVKNKADLQKWSCHSLRVGACVILHSMGFTESEIKHLLRWKSNAFMDYLRNTAILADKQRRTITSLASQPDTL